MKHMIVGVIAGLLGLVGCGDGSDVGRVEAAHSLPPEVDGGPPPVSPPGLCRMTGGGQIVGEGASPDSYGGNAQPFRSGPGGEWNHVTHDGQHFHGHTISVIECEVGANDEEPPSAGFSNIFFSGTGTFDGVEDCYFEVHAEDHGEGLKAPARDEYAIAIDCAGSDADYSTGAKEPILHGNIQIHPIPPGFVPRSATTVLPR